MEVLALISTAGVIVALAALILLLIALRVKNVLFRTVALIAFLIIPPATFATFVELTGEARMLKWDYFRNTPEKFEVRGFYMTPRYVYLLLIQEGDPVPIHYKIHDPDGSVKESLLEQIEAMREGEGQQGRMYFYPDGPPPDPNFENSDDSDGGEYPAGGFDTEVFEAPSEPKPERQNDSEILEYNVVPPPPGRSRD